MDSSDGYLVIQKEYWLSNGIVDSIFTTIEGVPSASPENEKTDPVLREYHNLLAVTPHCNSTKDTVCLFLKHASFDPETGLLKEYEFDYKSESIAVDGQTRHVFKNPIWE